MYWSYSVMQSIYPSLIHPTAIIFTGAHLKGTRGGVQHGVWTSLPSFMIIRESIDITMMVQHK